MPDSVLTASRPTTAPGAVLAGPARPEDAEPIALLSAPFVEQGLLVARSTAELESAREDFVVARAGDRLVGCAGLAPSGGSLVLYNLCIAVDWQGRGIGRHLVAMAENIGRDRGYASLLALTRHGGEWFANLGFSHVPPSETREEWRTLFRPGRGSSLYRLALAPEQSRDLSTPPCRLKQTEE